MRTVGFVLAVPLLHAIASCGPAPPMMTETLRRHDVQQRAAFDLVCDDAIRVQELGRDTYGAIGCGRRASYYLQYCDDDHYVSACTVLLNGTAEPVGTSGGQTAPPPADPEEP